MWDPLFLCCSLLPCARQEQSRAQALLRRAFHTASHHLLPNPPRPGLPHCPSSLPNLSSPSSGYHPTGIVPPTSRHCCRHRAELELELTWPARSSHPPPQSTHGIESSDPLLHFRPFPHGNHRRTDWTCRAPLQPTRGVVAPGRSPIPLRPRHDDAPSRRASRSRSEAGAFFRACAGSSGARVRAAAASRGAEDDEEAPSQ